MCFQQSRAGVFNPPNFGPKILLYLQSPERNCVGFQNFLFPNGFGPRILCTWYPCSDKPKIAGWVLLIVPVQNIHTNIRV